MNGVNSATSRSRTSQTLNPEAESHESRRDSSFPLDEARCECCVSCGDVTTTSYQHGLTMKDFRWGIGILIFVLSYRVSYALRTGAVLGTSNPVTTQWACFEVEAEDCCEAINLARQDLGKSALDPVFCQSQLAAVPSSLALPKLARFSLTLPTQDYVVADSAQVYEELSLTQFLWTIHIQYHEGMQLTQKAQEAGDTLFPLMLQPSHPTPHLSLQSNLSQTGGMHRLFHHQLQTLNSAETSYIFLTIPKSMFVDLDDAIELDDDENGVFVHFAATCDIEQPSFTSGQHVIALEINHLGRRHSSSNVASTVSIVVDFATKLHFRYPEPCQDSHQSAHLFMPLLLTKVSGQSVTWLTEGSESNRMISRLPQTLTVPAGSDDDHTVVMWTTMLIGFAGMLLILHDFGQVSVWDP